MRRRFRGEQLGVTSDLEEGDGQVPVCSGDSGHIRLYSTIAAGGQLIAVVWDIMLLRINNNMIVTMCK